VEQRKCETRDHKLKRFSLMGHTGDLSEPCGGRDCSTCQCFPAKGARVRLPDYSHTCMFSSLQRTCMNFFALN
uniref:Uncharacterized protein n=1 Tax=Oreochromis aureus TaxID=47969 RepID=A0AAZ1X626_OREAU